MAPRQILVAGFGAFLVLYVLTAVWVVVVSDTESAAAPTPLSIGAPIEVTIEGTTIRLRGAVASETAAVELIDTILDRTNATTVINELRVDTTLNPTLDVEAVLTRIGAEATRTG